MPLLPSAKVSVAVAHGDPLHLRRVERNRAERRPGGPNSVPAKVLGPVWKAVIDRFQALPLASWVNQVAKITSPWCAKLMPQPASDSAGAAYHMPWKFSTAGGAALGDTDADSPAKLVARFCTITPLRLIAFVPSVGSDANVTWSTLAKLRVPPSVGRKPFGMT